MTPIRVRALRNVLGLVHGDVTWLAPTAKVERLIRAGHLEWLDDPGPEPEPEPAPVKPKRVKADAGPDSWEWLGAER